MNTKRVLVALSGGVDSSVCVHLLKQQGYDVQAVVLDASPAHSDTVLAAQEAARALDIPLTVERCHEQFEREVVRPFSAAYRSGKTPNPCIFCNPAVKFERITAVCERLGCDYTATGHYAGIVAREGRYQLCRAACLARDQSYMLYRLTQRQLSRLLLPLAGYEKSEIRAIAQAQSLPCANKPDSQEICFIPDNDYAGYLERLGGRCEPGDFISPEGKPVGRHNGILHYTIGQRKGLGLALGRPVFVRRIDPVENRIYLGYAGEEYAAGVLLEDCVCDWLGDLNTPLRTGVKIRYAAPIVPCTVSARPEGLLEVRFDTPQRAPAPGQSCVFYEGDRVLGGGYIREQLL